MSDQQITCSECGDVFVFTAAEKSFYDTKGLASPPKRCKPCRAARKASGGGPGGGGGRPPGRGGDARPAPRFSNDAHGYRAPTTMGRGPGGGGNDRPPARAPRSHGGAPAPSGAWRSRGDQPTESRGPGGNARPARAAAPRASSDFRSPAFPDQRWEPRRSDARPERAPHASRPSSPPHPPAENRPPKARAERPERPKFDITCGECGVPAQVPFRPIEGRQVFCQDCYRARRGIVREGGETAEPRDTDNGIVE